MTSESLKTEFLDEEILEDRREMILTKRVTKDLIQDLQEPLELARSAQVKSIRLEIAQI